MKKFLLLLTFIVALSSCESEVKFNTPAFQVFKDNAPWKAGVVKAKISDDILTMTAFRGSELITLVIPAPSDTISNKKPVVHTLGVDDETYASYKFIKETISITYKTGKEIGNGEIVITEFDPNTKKLSGNFHFNGIYQGTDPLNPTTANFQQGFIYKIQID